jgi:hypothetical protein
MKKKVTMTPGNTYLRLKTSRITPIAPKSDQTQVRMRLGWVYSTTTAGLSLAAWLTLLSGCKRETQVVGQSPGSPAECIPIAVQRSSTPAVVTYWGDLWPILRSNRRGYVYKCTTCHAEYNDPKSLVNAGEVARVVESMRSGRMPRGGDAVPAGFIQLFSEWRLQGFKLGEPGQGPSNSGLNAGIAEMLAKSCQ